MRDWGAKHAVAIVLAAVVGIVIGGLPGRDRVRALETQVELLEDRPCDGGVGRGIAQVFQGRPWEAPGAAPVAPAPSPEIVAPEPAEDDDDGGPAVVVTVGDDDDEQALSDPQTIEAMRDAMDARRAQARQALREQAGASDDQLDAIDQVVDDMNAELRTLAEDFVDTVAGTGGEPGRREMMLFAADTLDVLIGAEDQLYSTLEEGQREGLDDEVLDPLSYVDGSVVEVLQELDEGAQ